MRLAVAVEAVELLGDVPPLEFTSALLLWLPPGAQRLDVLAIAAGHILEDTMLREQLKGATITFEHVCKRHACGAPIFPGESSPSRLRSNGSSRATASTSRCAFLASGVSPETSWLHFSKALASTMSSPSVLCNFAGGNATDVPDEELGDELGETSCIDVPFTGESGTFVPAAVSNFLEMSSSFSCILAGFSSNVGGVSGGTAN